MKGIILKPEPNCPKCGKLMKLRKPKEDQEWEPFWGCFDFPKCRGSVNIDPETGRPDYGDPFPNIDPLDDRDDVP